MPNQTTDSITANERFELNQILNRVWANRGKVLICVVICLGVGLGYTVLSPAIYEAKTTVFFPARASSILGPSGVTDSSGGGGSLLGGGGPSPLKIFRAFLESERALDVVAKQSGLPRKKLVDIRKVTEEPSSNTLSVSVFLNDKDKAKVVLDSYVAVLGQINSDLSVQSMTGDSEALRQELLRDQERLRKSESKLLKFQRVSVTSPSVVGSTGNNPTPTIQSAWGSQLLQAQIELGIIKAKLSAAMAKYQAGMSEPKLIPSDIPAVKQLRPELVKAEYQLRLSLQTLGPEAPEVKRERAYIKILRDQLHSELKAYLESVQKGLSDPTQSSSGESATLPNLMQQKVALEAQIEALISLQKVAPEEGRSLARLLRDVAIDSEIVKQATLQYQLAKLQSLRDPNKWSLLDPPRVFDEPVNKKYLTTSLLGILVGLFVGLVWSINFGKRDGLTTS